MVEEYFLQVASEAGILFPSVKTPPPQKKKKKKMIWQTRGFPTFSLIKKQFKKKQLGGGGWGRSLRSSFKHPLLIRRSILIIMQSVKNVPCGGET